MIDSNQWLRYNIVTIGYIVSEEKYENKKEEDSEKCQILIDYMGYIPYSIGEVTMPTISNFYGIIIVMYLRYKEHNPPHIHAITQDSDAPFLISNGEIMYGDFPPKAKAMVKEFILKYQVELIEMWETGNYKKLPPLR